MKIAKIKKVILWTLIGAVFGVAFGAVSAFFVNGPSVTVGIEQSWWWFAIAGLLKGLTDPELVKKN
ncbi:MAG: hypothetical protein H7326_07035 [Bdellovibrionaceae bacterium]|nr:hypothetical protein [Pseudobdellovibrionaceae bacterium]